MCRWRAQLRLRGGYTTTAGSSLDRSASRPADTLRIFPGVLRFHSARGIIGREASRPSAASPLALSLSLTHTQITDRRILPQVITGFGEFRFCSIALNFSLARPYAVNHTWGSTDYGHTRSPYDTPLFEVPLPFLLYMTVNSLGISLRLFSCSLVRVFFEHDDRQ
jgi:hypothetical protein